MYYKVCIHHLLYTRHFDVPTQRFSENFEQHSLNLKNLFISTTDFSFLSFTSFTIISLYSSVFDRDL